MNNLAQILTDGVNGSTFVSIDTVTTPKLTGGRENLMIGRVTKHMTGSSVMVFQNKRINGYEAMVGRRLEKEGRKSSDFTLSARSWGTRIPNTCFVEHKGAHYVEVIFLKPGVVHYELDGDKIEPEEITGLKEVSHATQGGLDDKVIIRSFKSESIKAIRINKHEYTNLTFELDEATA